METLKAIEQLAEKAMEASTAHEAMGFAQAALNLAHAASMLFHMERVERKANESPQEDRAALLAKLRALGGDIVNGKLVGRRGALAALKKTEEAAGRARETLREHLSKAAEEEASWNDRDMKLDE